MLDYNHEGQLAGKSQREALELADIASMTQWLSPCRRRSSPGKNPAIIMASQAYLK